MLNKTVRGPEHKWLLQFFLRINFLNHLPLYDQGLPLLFLSFLANVQQVTQHMKLTLIVIYLKVLSLRAVRNDKLFLLALTILDNFAELIFCECWLDITQKFYFILVAVANGLVNFPDQEFQSWELNVEQIEAKHRN
jgi:hypothetical protein